MILDRPEAHRPGVVIQGDVVHGNKFGGDLVQGDKYVGAQPARKPPKVILVMSADPDPRRALRLDEERRAIDLAVAWAHGRLTVHSADAVRLDDLQRALLRHRPEVVHFGGHGHPTAGIMVGDGRGGARPVPPAALTELFAIERPRCVVLNACYTDERARAIARHVPHVIGMRSRVLDAAAIQFAAGFYQAIAQGTTIRTAFDLGRNQMRLHGYADAEVPVLLAAPGAEDRPFVRRR